MLTKGRQMDILSRLDADAAHAREVEARARVVPGLIAHEGDCADSLCPGCGHCLHSLDECDHDCDGQGGGCADALPDPEVDFRRDVVRLVARLAERDAALRAVLKRHGTNGYPVESCMHDGFVMPCPTVADVVSALSGGAE